MTAITAQSARRRDQVVRYLDSKLLLLKPGEALPSVRQIMSDCGVSQLVVERAMADLRDAGFIEAAPRRGMFKSRRPLAIADLAQTIDIIHCGGSHLSWQDRYDFTGELIHALTTCCGSRGQSIRVTAIDRDAPVAQFNQVIERADAKACIILQPSRTDLIKRVFDPHHVPAVNLLPRSADLPPYSILVDAREGIRLQLEHLWSLGHERIAFLDRLIPGTYMRTFAIRREQYYQLMAQKGLRVSPGWVRYAGNNSAECHDVFDQILDDPQPPTAVIAADVHLVAIYQILARRGYTIGQDFSVMGTDGLSISSMMHPATTTLNTCRTELANRALAMLDRRLTGQHEDQPQEVQGALVVRESTGPLVHGQHVQK